MLRGHRGGRVPAGRARQPAALPGAVRPGHPGHGGRAQHAGRLRRADRVAAAQRAGGRAGAADYGLLLGLGLLALTGLLTLLLRATPAFGLILVIHLAAIVVCFAIAPYTRFVHAGYRYLALVADAIEQRRPGSMV